MIKINLLESVTERQGGTVASVDKKIASPAARLAVMALVVGFLTVAVIGWDIISTQWTKADLEKQHAEQKQIEADLAVVIAEQKELEQKIQNIDLRITAIKNLRASQAGPSAVLDAIRERIAMVPGLYIESIEQQGEQVTFRGNSPDESQVTQFGRSLEFSNGLFSNLSIETSRADITNEAAPQKVNAAGESPKVSIVNFTVKTAYTPTKAGNLNGTVQTATAAPGQTAAPAQPAQVAKN
ncbi:MAG TPA: PilN domain-containing protein [Pyrinomonadaceae bacterium]|nr:PilN domain-containing protein [Pyrinomonadaceae bacterium]